MDKHIKKSDIITAVAGNILLYYNVTLYGFLSIKLAPIFFPAASQQTSFLFSFIAFAAGFITRPLGGLVFGYLGDKLGRSQALYYSLFFGCLPAFVIGLLPSYESIGLSAPIILMSCRLIQGISIAGEWTNVTVYLLEQAPKNRLNYYGALLVSNGFIGAILSSALTSLFIVDGTHDWLWRVLFLVGGLLSIINICLRLAIMRRTRRFETKRHSSQPFKDLLLNSKYKILIAMLIAGAPSASFYICSIYINSLYVTQLGFSLQTASLLNLGLMVFWLVFIPLYGKAADRIGAKTMIFGSLVASSFAPFIAFDLINIENMWALLSAQLLLSLCNMGVVSATNSFLVDTFEKETRCTGIGLGFNLGTALFAGSAPTLSLLLIEKMELLYAPAYYISGLCLCCLTIIFAHSYQKNLTPAHAT